MDIFVRIKDGTNKYNCFLLEDLNGSPDETLLLQDLKENSEKRVKENKYTLPIFEYYIIPENDKKEFKRFYNIWEKEQTKSIEAYRNFFSNPKCFEWWKMVYGY